MADKRFLAFAWDTYYPIGGILDKQESFDTIQDAIKFLKNNGKENKDLYDREKGDSIDLELYGIH